MVFVVVPTRVVDSGHCTQQARAAIATSQQDLIDQKCIFQDVNFDYIASPPESNNSKMQNYPVGTGSG